MRASERRPSGWVASCWFSEDANQRRPFLWCILLGLNFSPTNGCSIKTLKVKILGAESKRVALYVFEDPGYGFFLRGSMSLFMSSTWSTWRDPEILWRLRTPCPKPKLKAQRLLGLFMEDPTPPLQIPEVFGGLKTWLFEGPTSGESGG